MPNANDNKLSQSIESLEDIEIDFFDEMLQDQVDEELAGLEFLEEEKQKIGNPDNLGEVIKDVVWQQIINQLGVTAGQEFIEENRGLHLDLRPSGHIQTTKNFRKGKLATHNREIDYKKRYRDYTNNFKKNEDGSIQYKVNSKTGKREPELRVRNSKVDPDGKHHNTNYIPRTKFDAQREKGSKLAHNDHIVPVNKIIKDAELAAHLDQEDIIKIANSEENIIVLDPGANQSKGSKDMQEWLNSERNGEKPAERFGLDEKELTQKNKEAKEHIEKEKEIGRNKSIETGKQSLKEETLLIGGKALQSAIMILLADFIKGIVAEIIQWFRTVKRTFQSLSDRIKAAIDSFVANLKAKLFKAAYGALTSIAAAIIGPVVGVIKKAFIMLKQGWRSLKEAIDYLKNPENKGKPIEIKLFEIGKIVAAALSVTGAIVLGELIEKGLVAAFAPLATPIPAIGSIAGVIGIFFGAAISGILGAIAINKIQKSIEGAQIREINLAKIAKGNEAMGTQAILKAANQERLMRKKDSAINTIIERHIEAGEIMKDKFEKIEKNLEEDTSIKEISDENDRLLIELEF